MRCISVIGQEVLELLVWTLSTLIDADVGILATLESCLEVLIGSSIVREFEPSSVIEVPGHIIL